MIQALEVSKPLAGTIAKERVPVSTVSLNAEAKAANTTPIAFLKQVAQAPSPFGRLKAAVLKHSLLQGMPVAQPETKAIQSSQADAASGSAPASEAESLFAARAFAARYAIEASDFAKTRIAADQELSSRLETDEFGMPKMSILTRGIEFPKLDPSWQVLPTADFAKTRPGSQLEMVV